MENLILYNNIFNDYENKFRTFKSKNFEWV